MNTTGRWLTSVESFGFGWLRNPTNHQRMVEATPIIDQINDVSTYRRKIFHSIDHSSGGCVLKVIVIFCLLATRRLKHWESTKKAKNT